MNVSYKVAAAPFQTDMTIQSISKAYPLAVVLVGDVETVIVN